ncbi:MAG: hypothetical protein ACLUFV_08450 [Acutalibacteraceae bacterium]
MGWWSICLSLTTNPRLLIRKRGGSLKSGQPAKKDEKRCNLQGLHRFAVSGKRPRGFPKRTKRRGFLFIAAAVLPCPSPTGLLSLQAVSAAAWAAMPFFVGVPMRSLGGRRFTPYALRAAPLLRLMLPASPTMLLLPVEKTSIARLLLFCG